MLTFRCHASCSPFSVFPLPALTTRREQAPRLVHRKAADDNWVFPDGSRLSLAGFASAGNWEGKTTSAMRFEDVPAGAWDPHARLKEMTIDGVSAEVVYPSYGMNLFRTVTERRNANGMRARVQRLGARVLLGWRYRGWSGWPSCRVSTLRPRWRNCAGSRNLALPMCLSTAIRRLPIITTTRFGSPCGCAFAGNRNLRQLPSVRGHRAGFRRRPAP